MSFKEPAANRFTIDSFEGADDDGWATDLGLHDWFMNRGQKFSSFAFTGNGINHIVFRLSEPSTRLSIGPVFLEEMIWIDGQGIGKIIGIHSFEEHPIKDTFTTKSEPTDTETVVEFNGVPGEREYFVTFNGVTNVSFHSPQTRFFIGENEFFTSSWRGGAGEFQASATIPSSLILSPFTIKFAPDLTYGGLSDWMEERYIVYSAEIIEKKETGYLTIIASPRAIPINSTPPEVNHGQELDYSKYSKLSNNQVNFATGRIFGLTPSDVSAYIARSLFFEKIQKTDSKALFLLRGTSSIADPAQLEADFRAPWSQQPEELFSSMELYAGYNKTNQFGTPAFRQANYPDNSLIVYTGHGVYAGWQYPMPTTFTFREDDMVYSPTAVLGYACETCSWQDASFYEKEGALFCANHLRRGSMIFEGTIGVAFPPFNYGEYFNDLYIEGKSIGDVYRKYKNKYIARTDPFGVSYMILGDPTFKPKWW